MTAFDQLLVGLALGSFGFMLLFAYLWRRELDRHHITQVSRDGLRHMLKEISARRDPHVVADSLIQALEQRREATQVMESARLRVSDEQSMVNALREADHHDMQEWK